MKETVGFAYYNHRWIQVVEFDWSEFEMNGIIMITFYKKGTGSQDPQLKRAYIFPIYCYNGKEEFLAFVTKEKLNREPNDGQSIRFVR